jgi:hypothetical protein
VSPTNTIVFLLLGTLYRVLLDTLRVFVEVVELEDGGVVAEEAAKGLDLGVERGGHEEHLHAAGDALRNLVEVLLEAVAQDQVALVDDQMC